MSKRTFQPNNRRRGQDPRLRARMATKNDAWVEASAAPKGRKRLTLHITKVFALFGMRTHLRDSREFQHVYRNGKRYDGVFITVLLLKTRGCKHRLGVTASKRF